MDVDLPYRIVFGTNELVRLTRSYNQNVAGHGTPFFATNNPPRAPGDYIDDLVVIVFVKPWTSTRLTNDQEE
ncbi:MAG: hypothetical protein ABSF59_22665 [Candidatus Sulfotelmatobacter sp.]